MASTREWFEKIAEAQRRAKKRLPPSVYNALVAGSEQGITLADNISAFSELGLIPRIGMGPRTRDQSTTVLGHRIPLPVIISPTGVQAVYPDAEVAVARAARSVRTIMGLSSFASMPIEAVVDANPLTFFQIYWAGSRERMTQILDRVRAAGAKALIATLDWSFDERRDWESPPIPERLDLRTMIKFAPQGITHPRWVLDFVRHGGLPTLAVPNFALPEEQPPTFFEAYGRWMQTPPPTWSDVAWLREQWGGPFIVKGVMHPDDARHAVEIGADAISVSNHGGNDLDGAPATIRVLASIVDAVGDQVEVLLDGGVRRGSDVVKALALGARAVMIGRAYLWGVAANGEAGVTNALDVLRRGIDSTLLGIGRSSIHDLTPDDIVIPPHFNIGPRPHYGDVMAEILTPSSRTPSP